jgi:hypothetical protein
VSDWEVFDAADQRNAHCLEVDWLADDFDVGQPGEQLPEDDCELAASEVRTQAEVGAGSAEADVRVGISSDVEAFRVVEHSRVAVGCAIEEDEWHCCVSAKRTRLVGPPGADRVCKPDRATHYTLHKSLI